MCSFQKGFSVQTCQDEYANFGEKRTQPQRGHTLSVAHPSPLTLTVKTKLSAIGMICYFENGKEAWQKASLSNIYLTHIFLYNLYLLLDKSYSDDIKHYHSAQYQHHFIRQPFCIKIYATPKS